MLPPDQPLPELLEGAGVLVRVVAVVESMEAKPSLMPCSPSAMLSLAPCKPPPAPPGNESRTVPPVPVGVPAPVLSPPVPGP